MNSNSRSARSFSSRSRSLSTDGDGDGTRSASPPPPALDAVVPRLTEDYDRIEIELFVECRSSIKQTGTTDRDVSMNETTLTSSKMFLMTR